ncbi:uncharacterized protein LOC130654932 [Hydractinia symbiolongicarpus]|uniref:uncharacterized protein LOC130654932 n=1 Tax=Hydractinia symbiolongicarpus TaxID=13093 RepID=UPI00254FA3B4|nr:uncharacterized protein LOC130654932 [Hydractinia symbiolongicarpus]
MSSTRASIVFTVFTLLLNEVMANPILTDFANQPCEKQTKLKATRELVDKLQSNHFLILESKVRKDKKEIPPPQVQAIKHFSKKRSLCPTELVAQANPNRFPQTITSVTLKYPEKNQHNCKPIYREIIYLQMNEKCSKDFNKKHLKIHTMKVIVAYEYRK